MKESHPVEVAEYARARGIDKEPAFEWWVPHTLKKRQVILEALKKRIRKTTHKYGIEIPTSVEHAFELDRKNGNNLWKDALEMEMYNIGVTFEILEDGKTAPAGYTKVSGHLIWSVKMDSTRKARVLDGHKTCDPVGSKYAGVVSRESVRIAFTYAVLNDLDVCMADIRNAYLQSPTSQSITLSVDQSLEWKMLARWLSCIEQSMVEKQVEEISETTIDHACMSSILLHVLLILMFG